ncbi:MAG: ABC transporter substrate-binding protein [Turicibacter sp.]
MKKLLTSLALLLALTTVVACSNESKDSQAPSTEGTETTETTETPEATSDLVVTISEPVTIEFWHAMSGPNEQVVNDLVEKFNTTIGQEKGITIEPVFQGSYNDLKSKTTAAIKAGEAPAISQAYPDWVAEYLEADIVVALDEYINHPEVGISDFEDIASAYRAENSQYKAEGTFYSLPFNKSTEVLYYNATFFEENGLTPPTTWEEMEALSKEIYELTGNPAFGIDSTQNMFITLVQQFGGKYTNSQGDILFGDTDAAVQTLDLIKRNTDAGYWRLAGEDKYMSGPFINELVYMYIGSTSGSAFVNNDNFDWASAPVPQVSDSSKAVIQQGTNVVVMNQNKSEEQVYAAFEFAKFLGSFDANLYWTMNTGYLPIRQTVIDSPEYQAFIIESGDTTKEVGPSQSSYYFYDPAFFTDTFSSYNVRSEVGLAVENVVLNGMDPAAAVEGALNALK